MPNQHFKTGLTDNAMKLGPRYDDFYGAAYRNDNYPENEWIVRFTPYYSGALGHVEAETERRKCHDTPGEEFAIFRFHFTTATKVWNKLVHPPRPEVEYDSVLIGYWG